MSHQGNKKNYGKKGSRVVLTWKWKWMSESTEIWKDRKHGKPKKIIQPVGSQQY